MADNIRVYVCNMPSGSHLNSFQSKASSVQNLRRSPPTPSTVEDNGLDKNRQLLDLLQQLVDKETENDSLKSELSVCISENHQLSKELDALRHEKLATERALIERSKEVSEISMKIQTMETGLNMKDKELRIIRDKEHVSRGIREDLVKQSESSLIAVEKRCLEEIDKRKTLAATLAEKDVQIETLRAELLKINHEKKQMEEQIKDLMKEKYVNQELLDEVREKDAQIEKMTVRITELETSLKQREEDLTRVEENLRQLRNENADLVSAVDQKEFEVQESIKVIEQLEADLLDAKNKVQRMEESIKSSQRKLEILNLVATKQDQIVSEKEESIVNLKQELKLCLERILKKEDAVNKLREELNGLRRQLEESREEIKTNENLITWLNKQLEVTLQGDCQGKVSGKGSTRPATSSSGRVVGVSGLPNDHGYFNGRLIAEQNRQLVIPAQLPEVNLVRTSNKNPGLPSSSNNNNNQNKNLRTTSAFFK